MTSRLIKLANRVAQMLDRLTGVNYTKGMTKKPIITPERFKTIKEMYDDAVQQRQEEIKRLYFVEKWKPKQIADELGIDISQVSRFISNLEKEKG
jgi:DNA-directed RNA polymerase specialized sigma subunit